MADFNDTRDFGIGRLLTTEHWDALLRRARHNQRLLDAQLEACACAPDATTLERVVLPSTHDGQPAPGCASATRAPRGGRAAPALHSGA